MIHFPPHHHLSVLVRLSGFVEADCMQIQTTFLAKGSHRLFFHHQYPLPTAV